MMSGVGISRAGAVISSDLGLNLTFLSSGYAAGGGIRIKVGRKLGFESASISLKNPRFELRALIDGNYIKITTNTSKSSGSSALELLKTSSSNRYTRERSGLIVIGLSVHTSPVEMREKFAIPEAQWPQAIEELCGLNHIEEAAVLSTCNRMEIYVVALSQSRGVKEVTEWMSKTSGVPVSELCKHRFLLYNGDAVNHLFEVSSGLDSLVLGEGQILAQVKQVVKSAEGVPGFGRKISGLFKRAITVGKRVRTETKISSGAVSVSSAAVELGLVQISESSYENVRVLVIGAGKMGKLVIKHLVSKGCSKMVVINRTEEKVAALVEEYKDVEIIWKPLLEINTSTAEADMIFTCTASETPLLLKEHVQALALPSNGSAFGGVRHFIDISVPRNVGTCVAELETAKVYNVDDLKDVVTANKELRLQKARDAQEIISQELQEFVAWMDSLETVPTIKKLRAYAERIRAAELDKCLAKIGDDLSNQQKKAIQDLCTGILNKLLHGPMQHLRCDGSNSRSLDEILDNMHALNRIFDLDTDTSLLEEKIRAKVAKAKK